MKILRERGGAKSDGREERGRRTKTRSSRSVTIRRGWREEETTKGESQRATVRARIEKGAGLMNGRGSKKDELDKEEKGQLVPSSISSSFPPEIRLIVEIQRLGRLNSVVVD